MRENRGHFYFEKRASAHFLSGTWYIRASLETGKDGSGQKKWVFARFYLKSGQAETVGTQGFAGFLPTFPLFSLISVKKKCKKYI